MKRKTKQVEESLVRVDECLQEGTWGGLARNRNVESARNCVYRVCGDSIAALASVLE